MKAGLRNKVVPLCGARTLCCCKLLQRVNHCQARCLDRVQTIRSAAPQLQVAEDSEPTTLQSVSLGQELDRKLSSAASGVPECEPESRQHPTVGLLLLLPKHWDDVGGSYMY
jgi:hypothetical protein